MERFLEKLLALQQLTDITVKTILTVRTNPFTTSSTSGGNMSLENERRSNTVPQVPNKHLLP